MTHGIPRHLTQNFTHPISQGINNENYIQCKLHMKVQYSKLIDSTHQQRPLMNFINYDMSNARQALVPLEYQQQAKQ